MLCKTSKYCSLLLLGATAILAQAPNNPYQVCRRFGHQTAVLGRRLYIDGGWVNALNMEDAPIPTLNQDLLFSDLDQVNQNMPKQDLTLPLLKKPSNVPSVAGGVLWPDEVNQVLWQFGGETAVPGKFSLWGYDPLYDQWNLSSLSSASMDNPQRLSYGAGTNLWGNGYYLGGYSNNMTSSTWTGPALASKSMLRFNMDTQDLSEVAGPDNNGRAEGVMVSIPASNVGMLIYLGGVAFASGSSSEVPASMSEILLYDLGDARWFKQSTTGETPPSRRKFCAGVAWPQDHSSYNIYLYGGFGFGANSTGFDDLYILSMPAFKWIRWYPDNGANGNSPHGMLTCNVIEQAQMILMGGNWTNDNTHCDVPDLGGQHNLNLGQVKSDDKKWYDYQPDLKGYSVPQAILDEIGGSATGAATQSSPMAGFQASELAVYFATSASAPSRTPTRALPQNTNTSDNARHGSGTNTGAIVGGAVGGFAILLLLCIGTWYCLRRRKQGPAATVPANANELAGEPPADTKTSGMATLNSPSTGHSQPGSPYMTPPPPNVFPTQQHYHHQMQSSEPMQYYPMNMQQQSYGYAYPFHPLQTPQHSAYLPNQIFSLRPEVHGTSSDLHEMPVAKSPGVHHVQTPTGYNITSTVGSFSKDDDHPRSPRSPTQVEKTMQ